MQSVFLPTGRPKSVKEQDVYICDYRLDKSAHLFYKIHRNRYPVCTKPYAFNHFPKRLTPKRDFSVRVMGFLTGWGCCAGIYYWFINTERYFKSGGDITALGTFCLGTLSLLTELWQPAAQSQVKVGLTRNKWEKPHLLSVSDPNHIVCSEPHPNICCVILSPVSACWAIY